MSQFLVKYNSQIAKISAPITINQLSQEINQLFGVKQPSYSYLDEDNELIQVDIQLELNEAIRYLSLSGSELMIEEKHTGSTLQFIEDLPLLRSQITSDYQEEKKPEDKIESSEIIQRIRSEKSSESINDFEDLGEKEEENTEIKKEFQLDFEIKNQEITERDRPKELKERGIEELKEILEHIKTEILEETKAEKIEENIRNELTDIERNVQGKISAELVQSESDEEFPEIFIEKEEIGIDIEVLKNVVREEIRLRTSGVLVIHDRKCEICKLDPIIGVLYKCNKCYFYCCEACEDKAYHPHPHPLLKLKEKENVDKVSDLVMMISKQLKMNDLEKIRNAVILADYDCEKAVNYVLGLV